MISRRRLELTYLRMAFRSSPWRRAARVHLGVDAAPKIDDGACVFGPGSPVLLVVTWPGREPLFVMGRNDMDFDLWGARRLDAVDLESIDTNAAALVEQLWPKERAPQAA